MVVNVIKWRPRPPLNSRKYDASITVRCLKGVAVIGRDGGNRGRSPSPEGGLTRLTVEIRWKGSKVNGLRALSRKVKRNCTREEAVGQNGVVQWNEEFKNVCSFSGYNNRDGFFNPWEVEFIVLNASDLKQKKKVVVAGPAVLNLAEFASIDGEKELEISIPLPRSSGIDCSPSICLTLHLTELRNNQESLEAIQRSVTLPLSAPLSPCFGVSTTAKKNETSTIKKSLRKVKSLTEYVSSRRKSKKAYHGEASSDSKFSTGSDNSESNYLFDTDSLDYSDEGILEESKDISDNVAQNSYGYGTLVSANLAGGMFDLKKSSEDEDLVFSSHADDSEAPEQILKLSPKTGILKWKKRKLSFRSPKVRGEPLLKKEYGDSGGDDIDFDRRQLCSSDVLSRGKGEEESLSRSAFGDDMFAVGSWERKEVVNRDGSMKLQAQVFFSTIDQRNEKAAGESACTALVAVIADWLHSNPGEMPTRSEFDALIRDGSFQWRSLCEVESYMTQFPDKHFDLETVIQAKIRPITVVAEKSFIGFFHPEELMEDEEGLGFLHGAMSFDNIWDEISHIASECATRKGEPLIYIVSWNDHFFALKIEADAYYVIDTLGERLFEGCNLAYVLKFDKDTTIYGVPMKPSKEIKKNNKNGSQSDKSSSASPQRGASKTVKPVKLEAKTAIDEFSREDKKEVHEEDVVVCKGKETCKEYIKSFLAAIPLRELQADIKNGRTGSMPLHHRLQIEFHHTVFVPTPTTTSYTVQEVAEPESDIV
ncbi:hypothetical protein V2J09_001220 [Rumex salicifolius]